MISNAFKSAYMNEQSAINETGNNVANAVKGAGTLIAGIAAFTGALGDGTVATAAKHNLAGKIGGIGGNIMLASIDEKRAVAQSQQIQNLAKLSEEELDARFEPIAKGAEANSLEEQVVDTVWNKIQKERAKNLEKNLVNKLDLQQFASKQDQIKEITSEDLSKSWEERGIKDYWRKIEDFIDNDYKYEIPKINSSRDENSGYSGYSMSKRATNAYSEGKKPLSKFNKYDMEQTNTLLKAIGSDFTFKNVKQFKKFIEEERYSEWHHSSSYKNETNFYSIYNALTDNATDLEELSELLNKYKED